MDSPRKKVKRLSDEQILALWKRLASLNGHESTIKLKEQIRFILFNHYKSDIKKMVRSTFSRVPSRSLVSFDDLYQAAMLGHIESLSVYDPSVGTSYMQFSYRRINGAMIDCMRKLQHFPRSISLNRRVMKHEVDSLTHELGHNPTNEEIIEHVDNSKDIIEDPLFATNVFTQLEGKNEDGESREIFDILEDTRTKKRTRRTRNLESLLLRFFEDDEDLQFTMWAYYYMGMNTEDISAVLKKSMSSVSILKRRGEGLIYHAYTYREFRNLVYGVNE